MRTIERNYRKNPHTASFLQVFHSGIDTDSRNYRAEMAANENRSLQDHHDDLLDLVPETAPAFQPSPAQRNLIIKLTGELADTDTELHQKAVEYSSRMDLNQAWTRENTSRWIGNLIAKVKELRNTVSLADLAKVADGRYAVEEGGTLKFFRVKNGRKPGFVFLDVQASDDLHPVRNLARIRAVLALIAVDPKAAMVRYGKELGICGRCGRTLTSEYRNVGLGPICIDK